MGTKFPQEHRANLSNQFTNELMKPSVDLATDFSEIFIDYLIENEVIKEIPIVKSIVGVINTGISINQFFFAKKLLTFIQEFNSGKIDQKKREEFHQRLIEDDKYRKKTTEQIMVFLDRYIEINKAKISAKLFQAYVEGDITYNKFISISICLEKLHPDSYPFLSQLEKLNYKIGHEFKGERLEF